eukprot:14059720-Alexandrium_andersonii.AAC.1
MPISVMPTLLRNSVMYHFGLKRMLVGAEAFAVNGVPVFADIPDELACVPPEVFCKMAFPVAKRLSGNMMNIPVVGSVIAVLVLATAPSDLAAPGPE